MKDKAFIIKVGDLLKEAGKSDEIIMTNKWSDNVPGLTDEGIAAEISLQSLSKDSVFVDLENIACDINSICDTCEKQFIRSVFIEEYSGKYVLGDENIKLEQEHSEEEIFPINSRDESIDAEELIVQAIRLDEPVVIHCAACVKALENIEDEDDTEYFESTQNINFH